MNNNKFTHIVFDLDDTLTDSYSFNQEMFVETFKQHIANLDKSKENYLRQLHKNSRGISMLSQFQQAAELLNLEVKAADLVAENEILHTRKAGKIVTFANVKRQLEDHKSAGRILSICTNRQTKSSSKILINNRIESFFTKIISCSDEGHEKPDPFCLNKLIREFKISKENVLYIGDSPTDRLFAKNAGVKFELAKN